MNPLVDKLLDEVLEAARLYAMDLVGEGIALLRRVITGEASDAEIIAYLKARQEARREKTD